MNTKLNFKQIITAGVMAAGASLVINAILFFIFKAAGVITDDIFVQPNQPLTIVPVIISSILPSLVGACIFFLFEKYSKNGFKVFSIVALVLMVLSFVNPFMGIPGITVAYGIVLDVMHVVVALALLYFIKRAKK
jgi:hypothetical protein